MKILIICVGGTIDKVYFDANSQYEVGEPAVRKMLRSLPVHFDYEVLPLMAKDSLDMSETDRARVAKAVIESEYDKIVVTHGTDTMQETAMAIGAGVDKTVVFTGALAPAIFRDTDAQFNLGGALAAVQVLPSGSYIVMNGEVFPANQVKKDLARKRFVRVS